MSLKCSQGNHIHVCICMYIQHVREAAERYMQHMYTNENYLQNIHSNIHVCINNSHGKKFLLLNTM